MISLDVTDMSASELQQEVVALRRRVKKLTALLQLALALLRSSGTSGVDRIIGHYADRRGEGAPSSPLERVASHSTAAPVPETSPVVDLERAFLATGFVKIGE